MLEFDASKHEYKADGNIIKSVTQLLPERSFYCTQEQLEAARKDGQEKHDLVRMYYDSGCQTFDDPFLEQYHNIIETNKYMFGDFVFNEQPIYSPKYKTAGTPDTFYTKALLDLKRSWYDEKIHALQLAGYALILSDNGYGKIKKWFIIYGENGKLKIKNVYNELATHAFIALLKKNEAEQIINAYLKTIN